MESNQIIKKLTARTEYHYTTNSKVINNEEHYQVIETVDTLQGREELKMFADREGYKMAGGSFTTDSLPYGFETHYNVIATNITQAPIKTEKVEQIKKIYRELKEYLGTEIIEFVNQPITLEDLAFTNEAMEWYLAKTNQLEKLDREIIMDRLQGGYSVKRGGYSLDFSDYLANFIVKFSSGEWVEMPAFSKESIYSMDLEVLKVMSL